MLCACYDQLKIGATYLNKAKKSIIHMDSCGKFLKQKGTKKKLLNTAIVIPPPAPGHAPFPLLELISQENKTIDFKILLETGWSLMSTAIGDNQVKYPDIAVTDLAFPNIHSMLSVFNQVKLKDYLESCYSCLMTNKPMEHGTMVSFCENHLLPLILKTARASGTDKAVADTVVAGVMLVLHADTIEEALEVWEQVVIAFCSKEANEDVEKARKYIEARSKGDFTHFEDVSQHNYDFEDETARDEEVSYGNRKLLRVNSPFYKLFKRLIDKIKKEQDEVFHTTNQFYAPKCLEVLVKQYLSLFPLLSASVLDGVGLLTNSHIELYWQEQRRMVKDIPDRLMWPPRYLGRLLSSIRNEAKNFLLHNIIPTLKFGGKLKTGDDIHFGDLFDEEGVDKQKKNVFRPAKSPGLKRKKKKVNESFYGSQEEWDSQKKRSKRKSNYIKGKHIEFDTIIEDMEEPVKDIRVTGTRKALGDADDYDSSKLAPMEILLKAEDVRCISTLHSYITTDAVDAGLCLLDRKLNEESAMNVTVYSTQNCRIIFNGEKGMIKLGKFITIVPRNFGIGEEESRMETLKAENKETDNKKTRERSEPGGHFTLMSNLFCGPDEVNVFETFSPYRNDSSLLTANCKKFLKSICKSETKQLKVNCVNVAEQLESECGPLSVALAVHLCFYSPSENAIYKRIEDVRNSFLDCLKQNSLTYFRMSPRHLEPDYETLFTIKI